MIGAGALGAFLGDNTAYLIGRRFAPWFERRAKTREKTAKRLLWAHDQIEKRGGLLLITARFIPGGRTVLTLSCGITEQRWRWFGPWVAVGRRHLGDLRSWARRTSSASSSRTTTRWRSCSPSPPR